MPNQDEFSKQSMLLLSEETSVFLCLCDLLKHKILSFCGMAFFILLCSRSRIKPWASKYFLASGRCCFCPISLTSASHFLDVFLFLAPIRSLLFDWIRVRISLALLPGNKCLVCSSVGELLMVFSDSCNLLSKGKCSYLWSKGQVLLLKHLLEQRPLLGKVKPGQLELLS